MTTKTPPRGNAAGEEHGVESSRRGGGGEETKIGRKWKLGTSGSRVCG